MGDGDYRRRIVLLERPKEVGGVMYVNGERQDTVRLGNTARARLACGHFATLHVFPQTGGLREWPRLGDVVTCLDCEAGKLAVVLFEPCYPTGEQLAAAMGPLQARGRRQSDQEDLEFKTRDFEPTAEAFRLAFPLPDGRTLHVWMGAEGRARVEAAVLGEILAREGANDDQEDR